MADFVELGLEGFDKTADKYFDKGYDKLHNHRHRNDRYQDDKQDNMSEARGRDRGYDSGSDDSYNERPRRRGNPRDNRNDIRPRQSDDRESDRPRRVSPPGPPPGPPPVQSYQPGAGDVPPYIPYQNMRSTNNIPPTPQYYPEPSRPTSRDYTPTSSARSRPRNEMTKYSRAQTRSPSRSRSHRQRRRSFSSSRSRSRSSNRDYKDNPLMALDKSKLGLGAGIAGALIGGYIGRETSDRHQKRGTALGVIIGGIGANILEKRVRIYRDEMKEEQREAREKWDARHSKDRKGRRVESPQRW
ncbi:hypothetical protein E4T42_06747 [Aureobasidium subglaciale]|nr:hypothetical protein E4T42_06747 [Aureobasidium subglaciale]